MVSHKTLYKTSKNVNVKPLIKCILCCIYLTWFLQFLEINPNLGVDFEFSNNVMYNKIYKQYIELLVTVVIPWTVLLYLNTRIYFAVTDKTFRFHFPLSHNYFSYHFLQGTKCFNSTEEREEFGLNFDIHCPCILNLPCTEGLSCIL